MNKTILEMHTKGYSQREIAKEIGISHQAVGKRLKKLVATSVSPNISIGKTLLATKNSSLEAIPDKTNLKGRKSETNWSIYNLIKRQDCYYDIHTGEVLDEKYNEVMDILYELVINWKPFGRKIFTNLHSYCFMKNKNLDISQVNNMISRFFICIQKKIVLIETVHVLDGYTYDIQKPIQNSLYKVRGNNNSYQQSVYKQYDFKKCKPLDTNYYFEEWKQSFDEKRPMRVESETRYSELDNLIDYDNLRRM